MSSIERRTLAILHGDVAGYTELAAGEEAVLKMLSACRDLIGATVVASHGRLVDFHGDEFLAEFGSAEHALQCAVQVQRSIHQRNALVPRERRMNFRLGLHVGEACIEGDRISGDSVNIAARLQRLSQAGGICLSRQVLDRMSGDSKLEIQDLGEHMLIHRIPVPVQAFSVSAASLADDPSLLLQANGPSRSRTTQGIPTIAVLPFDDLLAEPQQKPLVDGITADIATGLACDKRFSVVAASSARQFKLELSAASAGEHESARLRDVGRTFGVRYVVEGSVRRIGNKLRVTTGLIDVETAAVLWNKKIDRELADLHAMFDEVVEAVVTALSASLRMVEGERYRRKPSEKLDAWALTAQASTFAMNEMSLAEALSLVVRALQIDPEYGHACAVHGYLTALKFPLGISVDRADTEASLKATAKALRLDPKDPYSLTVHAVALQYAGRPSESMEYLHRSLRLNPSDLLTHCYYGRGLMFTGKPDLALAHFERFNRLNFNGAGELIAGMYHSIALVFLQRWKEAEETARRALAASVGRNPWTLVMLMISLGGQERHGEAAEQLARLKALAPHFDRGFVERFLDNCQEHKPLLLQTFALLRTVWPDERTRGPETAAVTRLAS